ncbi:MAG: SBBP repeat-containing protein, partial [Candidatus Sulfotelmatobacter sp.]
SGTSVSLQYSAYVGGSQDDSGIAIAVDGSGNAYVVGGTKSTDFATGLNTGFQPTPGGGSVDAFVFELASNGGSLTFTSYLGGTGDDIPYGVAVDAAGVYIAGTTSSANLQTSGAFQPALQGSPDAFVAKVNTSGSTKLYFSYLGAGGESLSGLDIDSNHMIYVTGAAVSTSFPVTPTTAYQKSCKSCASSLSDAFVTVINPAGSGLADLFYSTFLGGSKLDQAVGIAVDRPSGKIYVTGVTQSGDFPVSTPRSFGGTQNAFVTALNPTAAPVQQLIYSTYLGGTKSDFGAAIALDSSQTAYVTGETNSPDFPVAGATQASLNGSTDAFISEISPSGQLLFSTFLGGSGDENQSGAGNLTGLGAIAVDPAGSNIYVAGNTSSSNFPATSANVQPGGYGGAGDAYVAKFSNTGFSITNGALSPTSGHAGVAATATISVGSTGGFAGQVKLTCTVSPTPAKAPTCSLSPTSVTLTANGSPQNATLSVATAVAAARLENPFDGRGGLLFATILPVFGVTLLGAGMKSSDSRRKKLFGLFLLGMMAMTLMLMPACSSSSTTVGGGGGGGTPPGAYIITVTGTSGGATATGSPAITLTIN